MRNIKIYATLFFAICILPGISFGQANYSNLFYVQGSSTVVSVQGGALLHVQGDVNIQSGGTINNDGVLNVEGDFLNAGTLYNDAYGAGSPTVSGGLVEGTVRLIGDSIVSGAVSGSTVSGKAVQTISMASGSFYNLVIDRESAGNGEEIALASDVTVSGSLVWGGASNATTTYNPRASNTSTAKGSSILSNSTLMQVRGAARGGSGIIQLYQGTTDHNLTLSQSFTQSNTYMAGYKAVTNVPYSFGGNYTGHTSVTNPITSSTATNDQYLQSRGVDGITKGLTMTISGTGSAGTYTLPLGGPNRHYNPVQIHLASDQTSGITLTSKFTEYTTGTSTFPGGSLTTAIDDHNSTFGTATTYMNSPANSAQIATNEGVNPGYAVFQVAPCETGSPSKWFIADQFLTSAGYWSISNTGTLAGSYTIQTFPQGYSESTTTSWGASIGGPNRRTVLQNGAALSTTPSVSSFYSDLFGTTSNASAPTTDVLRYSYLGGKGSTVIHGSFLQGASCTNDATGVPGGEYTAFGHYGIITSSVNSGQALPVDLISLTADPINNTFIMVSWATASEQANKGFEVQRSIDGINFTTIGWVDGHGTTDEQNNYSYNDNNVEPNVQYYYRLNQVNVDGVGTLTYIVSAEITAGPSITVSEWMPNPTTGAIRLVVNTTDQLPISVRFYDMLGKMVLSSSNQAAYGTNTFDFDLGGLTDGTYTASIKVGTNTYSKKVVLVK